MGYSDVHWGSEDVDYNAIRRHVELLKTIPNLYAFCLGDVNEFAKLKHRGAVEGQIHSPTVQARAARAVFLETWEKWLTVVLGNHDMRVFLESGFDIGEYLIGEVPPGKKRIPFMRDGGLVTIELGQQVYTVNVFHGDSAFGTRFNENHKGRQTARLVDGRTDAQFNGHTHNPAVQDTSEPSDDMQGARSAVYVQCGSYKVLGDDHARRRKYLEVSDVQMGTIIAFPDTHRILGFKRVEEAVVILGALTEHYERGGSITDYMP
jgi:predicted phosphodiesterase